MIKCEQVQQSLADYRTGLVGDGKRAKMEAHLSSCTSCARELRVLDDVLALMESNALDYNPPAGLWNGVCNRIGSPAPQSSWLQGWLDNTIQRPIKVAGVGLAGAVLIVGLIVGGVNHKAPGMQSASASNEYIRGHALYASQSPLADQVSYINVAASSSDQTPSETN